MKLDKYTKTIHWMTREFFVMMRARNRKDFKAATSIVLDMAGRLDELMKQLHIEQQQYARQQQLTKGD